MTAIALQKPESPYPGLRPFEPYESSIFFGRAEQIAAMLTKLEARRFLAVVGSSGSGKSSLVRAGLLPALRDGFLMGTTDDWLFVIARPGSSPYASLADSFCRAVHTAEGAPTPFERSFAESQLKSGRLGIVELFGKMNVPPERHVLVLIDQFEELFRFRSLDDADKARNDAIAFVDLLLRTAEQNERTVHVVITMRSDFLGDCNAFFGLPEAISDSQFLVPRLTRDELAAATEGPLPQFGAKIQPDVVNHIVNEIGADPDQLPLMQHALMRMWEFAKPEADAQTGLELRADHYGYTGGVEMALTVHATIVYESLAANSDAEPPTPKQRVAQWLFRCLAHRTPKGQLVRRLTTVREVAAIAGATPEMACEVVRTFAAPGVNFLVTSPPGPLTESTSIDICHESLLRQWLQLHDWVKEESAASSELLKLVEDAALWKADRRGFLRQPELGLFQKWRKESVPSNAWAERYVASGEFELADEYLRRSQTQERRSRRILVGIVVTALSVIAILTVYSVWSAKQTFETSRIAAETSTIAATKANYANYLSMTAKKTSFQAARNLAVSHVTLADAEIEKGNTAQGIFSYWRAYCDAPANDPIKRLSLDALGAWSNQLGEPFFHGANVFYTAFVQEGKMLVTAGDDGVVRFWDPRRGKILGELKLNAGIMVCAMSPDGRTVCTGGRAKLWNVEEKKLIRELPHTKKEKAIDIVGAVSFSNNGKLVATGGFDGIVNIWDSTTGAHVKSLKHGATIGAMAFSKNDNHLLALSLQGAAKVWDQNTGNLLWQSPSEQQDQTSAINMKQVAFSPDGHCFVTGANKTATVWRKKNAEYLKEKEFRHDIDVSAAAFSPDSQSLAIASADGAIALWDVATGGKICQTAKVSSIWSLAFSSDGKKLLTSGPNGMARLLDLKMLSPSVVPLQQSGYTENTTFSRDRKLLVASRWRPGTISTIESHNTESGQRVHSWELELKENVSKIIINEENSLAIASTWTTIAINENEVVLLQTKPGGKGVVERLPHGKKNVMAAGFAAAGKTIVTVTNSGEIRSWDGQGRLFVNAVQLNVKEAITALALSEDADFVVTGTKAGDVQAWACKSGKLLATFGTVTEIGAAREITFAALSPDRQILMTATNDHALFWEAKTGRRMNDGFTIRQVQAATFSSNGQIVLISESPNDGGVNVGLWDVKTGTRLSEPIEKHPLFLGISFSPADRLYFTARADSKGMQLWSSDNSLRIGPKLLHQEELRGAAFAPDGQSFLTATDKKIYRWNIAPPAANESEKLRLSVEVRTGYYLDKDGVRRELTQTRWLDRREQLDKLGGFCDVRSWNDLTEAEKLDLRTPRKY